MSAMTHCGTVQIETERLLLRRFTLNDADDMFRNICSDSRVNRFLTWQAHTAVDETASLLGSFVERYKSDSRYCWAIVEKKSGQVIGTIAAPTIKELTKTVEVTYALAFSHWGNGITAEALKAVISFLFEKVGVNRIEAGHDINNPNSGKVMTKAGMRQEGVLRQAGKNNSGIFDLVMYSILRKDFESEPD